MIGIVDYDAGNIKSVEKAVAHLGGEVFVSREPEALLMASHVILPGVGNFGEAMVKLHLFGLVDVVKRVINNGTPFLGICLGMQLLFEESQESPDVPGLGILKGQILKIPETADLKVPNIGWNSLNIQGDGGTLYEGVEDGSFMYFVHSYFLQATDRSVVTSQIDYGTNIDASVQSLNVCATQFHPEKSSDVGLKVLKNFLDFGA